MEDTESETRKKCVSALLIPVLHVMLKKKHPAPTCILLFIGASHDKSLEFHWFAALGL